MNNYSHNSYTPLLADIYYPSNIKKMNEVLKNTPLNNNINSHLQQKTQAMLVPHSRWEECLPILVTMYHLLKHNLTKNTIIILGHTHHYYFEGFTIPEKSNFQTPFGDIKVDSKLQKKLIESSDFFSCWDYLGPEQSIEVQLPLIKYFFPDKQILPIVVGNINELSLAQIINQNWDNAQYIITSDLAIDKDYGSCLYKDRETSRSIESLDGFNLTKENACGYLPLKAFLLVAQERGLRAKTIELKQASDFDPNVDIAKGLGGHIFF